MSPPDRPLDLLYQDQHLVVVNKPSGMAVHRGWASDGPFVLQRLRDQIGRWVYPAHRLDRPTSGVLVFALDSDSARSLAGQFEAGTVEKRYLALVRGVTPETGLIDHPIRLDKEGEPKPARTEFDRLWIFAGRYSVVEARPLTGRRHQIRRHLKHISHPIIGDVRYGKGEHNRRFRADFGLHRLALHARSITLEHPEFGRRLTIDAPLPRDLLGPLAAMGAPAALTE